jgi:hydrogenase maturation protein HypF
VPATAIHITGVVQGVGFRPFVYRLAREHGLAGWVRNTSSGVDIEAEGPAEALASFLEALRAEAPPLAHIDRLLASDIPPSGHEGFAILHSQPQAGAFQPISPDIALCADCRRELFDPADRRYRYPFINCTNCGPRFTIIRDIPYDRPMTTMAAFALCPACAREYDDPLDRRFHAQPVACPDCGPTVRLEHDGAVHHGDDAIRATVRLLRAGAIVAIRGLGGFHLACDATDGAAVARLRARKHRIAKPFALMLRDLAAVEAYCAVSPAEAALLTSPASPIVLLRRRSPDDGIASAVAPGQNTLGMMLPYTPLHALLFAEPDAGPLVMTSGNHSDEPIVTDNEAALEHLAPLADAFLLHNRPIETRTDDSVMRVALGAELPIRRSRGYAPYPVPLPVAGAPLLAVGAEMKNTFCVTRDGYAFMSHHIGTLETYETIRSLADGAAHFERLFRITPAHIVHDMHPDYQATRYALARAQEAGLPAMAVQHHHAHIAAVMAEHGLGPDAEVLGICFDGTGYGTDGTIWGGEFLLAGYRDFTSVAHLRPVRLPGGDAATRKPARIGLAYALAAGADPQGLPPMDALAANEAHLVAGQIARGLNAPLTSSMGRLFDAIAAISGVCQVASYEGQAAIELEALTDSQETGAYGFAWGAAAERPLVIEHGPVVRAAIADQRAGASASQIAARFQRAVARMIVDVSTKLAHQHGLATVALSGGVFQNVTLLEQTVPALEAQGLRALTHRLVPPNDGGLALGQAAVAAVRLMDNQGA